MSTKMEFPRVFISYRREDSSKWTKSLFSLLADHLGLEQLFFDVENILPGVDFATSILRALHQCDVLLVMIGPKWLELTDETGRRRIDNPLDYVRMEIEESFSGVVLPILVGGAAMPKKEELPEKIQRLSRRQGIELREDSFEDDAARLINRIDELLLEAKANKEKKPKRSGLPIKDYFEVTLPTMLKWKNPLDVKQTAKQVGTVQFNVVGEEDGGTWTIKLEGSMPQVTSGPADNPDLMLKISESFMLDILAGQLDVESAVAKKEIEVFGDLKLLMTLGILFQGPAYKGPHLQSAGLSIRDYFEVVLPNMLKWKSSLAVALTAEEGGKLQFNVLGEEEGGTWTIDLEGPSPQVISGPVNDPDLTITVSDRAMYDILSGSFDAKAAVADGEIEISGDHKLLKNFSVLF